MFAGPDYIQGYMDSKRYPRRGLFHEKGNPGDPKEDTSYFKAAWGRTRLPGYMFAPAKI